MIKSPFLITQALCYQYPNSKIGLSNIDLTINEGEFHVLLGRSGSGKSTLLKLIAGLLRPQSGQIHIPSSKHNEPPNVSLVFQQPTLLEWLTVLDNVLLPANLKKQRHPSIRQHAYSLLEQFELAHLTNSFPHQLSGGQQSRVAIARALLLTPQLLLMDEPFAALDALTRELLQEHLLKTVHQHNTTVLFVTHDIHEAVFLADHISLLEKGQISFQSKVNLARTRTNALRVKPQYLETCQLLRQKILQAQ